MLVECACGCKSIIANRDNKGRLRRFISGHNGRLRLVYYTCKYCGKKFRRTFSSHKQKYCNRKCMSLAYSYKIDIDRIKDLYLNQLKSTLYIAKNLGVNSQTIVNHLKGHNIKLRPRGGNISRRIYDSKQRLINRRISEHKRRILSGSSLTLKDIQFIYERNIKQYGTLTCYLCGIPINFGEDSIDHKIPISRGGNNNLNNLEICHKKCNSSKFTKTYEEYKEAKNVT